MLQLRIEPKELWDEDKCEFFYIPQHTTTLNLEHSLISISKWEAKWKKAFLGREQKTPEQSLDYIRCMTLTPNVSKNVYMALNNDHMKLVNDYIDDPMTATTFSQAQEARSGFSREIVTSELIYYWMTIHHIPMECQKWHLNRLLTLIKVCNIKQQKPKKMSQRAIYEQNRALNAKRRAALNSKG